MGPGAAEPRRGREAFRAGALALVLLAVYLANGDFTVGGDSTGNVFVAANLLEEGRLTFTPVGDPAHFQWRLAPPEDRIVDGIVSGDTLVGDVPARVLWSNGLLSPAANHYHVTRSVRRDPATGALLFVNTFGPGAGLAAAPVLAVVRAFSGDLRRHPEALWYGAKFAASLLVAASAAFVFLAARAWISPAWALLVGLAYGLGTCAWSVSSQALWQHPAAGFFLALGALLLVRADPARRAGWFGAGLAFACAAACRPSDGVFLLAVAAWLAWNHRAALLALLAGAAPPLVALGTYNAWYFGAPWSFGQIGGGEAVALYKTGSPDLWQTPILTGLAGTLASPSRGLLVFSPIAILGLAGAVVVWRREGYARLRPIALGCALLLLVESRWFDWWGGWTFGYRRIVDLAPMLALLAVPTLAWVAAARWRAVAASALLAWSVAVQALGAFAYTPSGWNGRRAPGGGSLDVDEARNRHRLWSWTDAQLPYLLENLSAERQRRRHEVRRWLDDWRPSTRR